MQDLVRFYNMIVCSGWSTRFTMKTPKEKMSKKEVEKINVERKKFERKRRSYNMSKLLRCRS